ncbi:hypothetical protein M7I_2040 [Glarea lozoyensis 74030]|uniref:Uncharacterized protein n=1 Tax=Glarea lozoyensis (strain ATCC 74030 / MF5533) TaxID=1104152 RepID=H0EHQ6_GLAL7|nr:hypothetical protein M7I_2040 [Glarea lozoyensis 74030]
MVSFSCEDTQLAVVEAPPPEAPSPPSAAPGYGMSPDPVNVFDFLVTSETPNGSRNELPAPEPMVMIEDVPDESRDRELVRVHFEDYQDVDQSVTDLVQYGSAPIQSQFETPAPKGERERERRRERKDRDLTREEKKDKKRKRLHVETRDLSPKHDEEMTDAPPPVEEDEKLQETTRREHSSEERPKRKHRKHREASARPSKAKMIEYKPMHENADIKDDSQVVLYKPRSEILLDFVNKGPDSERGMSMHKALKRYHRERTASGIAPVRNWRWDPYAQVDSHLRPLPRLRIRDAVPEYMQHADGIGSAPCKISLSSMTGTQFVFLGPLRS